MSGQVRRWVCGPLLIVVSPAELDLWLSVGPARCAGHVTGCAVRAGRRVLAVVWRRYGRPLTDEQLHAANEAAGL